MIRIPLLPSTGINPADICEITAGLVLDVSQKPSEPGVWVSSGAWGSHSCLGESVLAWRRQRGSPGLGGGFWWGGGFCQLASLHEGILLGFQEQVALPGVLTLHLPSGRQQM